MCLHAYTVYKNVGSRLHGRPLSWLGDGLRRLRLEESKIMTIATIKEVQN